MYGIEKKLENTQYYDKYLKLKRIVADNVKGIEIKALLKSIEEFQEELKHTEKSIDDVIENYPLVYLTCHDINHINHVLERANELLKLSSDALDEYEIYLLACAILVHDVGNLQGREDHNKRVHVFLNSQCQEILDDAFERTIISKIASAHGGDINGDKDTISKIKIKMPLNNKEIKSRFLAAILRLSDELSDDSSRISLKDINSIPPQSIIYHYLSKCLHSIQILNDGYSNYIKLTFALDIEDAIKKFETFDGEKFLLDEIYKRTLKMECERIYCNKFLIPHIFIDRIEVEVNVYDPNNPSFTFEPIIYKLEEKGYPARLQEIEGLKYKNGSELSNKLKEDRRS